MPTQASDLGGTYPLNGVPVPRIGYGMGGVTRKAAEGPESRTAAVELLNHAYDLGIRLFDTAHFYGDGLANQLIHEALGDRREELFIASKVGARSTPEGKFPMTAAQNPHELRESVEVNLRTLQIDALDMVYLRRMDFTPGLVAEGDQVVDFDEQLAELSQLRDEGKIRAIGLSHVTLDQLRAALPVELTAVQNIYHLLGRADESLLELCGEHDVAWIPYFPLGGGGFANLPKDTDHSEVQAVADEIGATAHQVGLAWQLAHAENTLIISGTGSRNHLDQNVAAGSVRLTEDQLSRLDRVEA